MEELEDLRFDHHQHHHAHHQQHHLRDQQQESSPPPSSSAASAPPPISVDAYDPNRDRRGRLAGLMASNKGTVVKVFDVANLLGEKQCNHLRTVRTVPRSLENLDLDKAACSACGIKEENWMCLICHALFCGRYKNSHMLEHFRDTGHCVSMSLVDLSVWCYGCDMYLQHEFFPLLHRFFARMHQLKFHERPQNVPSDISDVLLNDSIPSPLNARCKDLGAVSTAYERLESLGTRCAMCEVNNVANDVNMNLREDWMCLQCGGVYCGRYHHKHALHHFQLTGHALSISFCDLSIWCYNCMQYIDHNSSPDLKNAYKFLQQLKQREEETQAPHF